MSVFKSLKGTFQTVQQDIVDGLRALTSLDSAPRHEKVKQLRAEGISLDAGADLLFRYQRDWSELQSYTTETAKRAEEVDSIVGEIFARYEHQWMSACRLEEEVATLPAIASTLNDMVQLISSLQKDFQAVEEELDKLQNMCEEEALEHEKESQMSQLAAYKKKKEADAFSVKGKLWNLLKDRAKELETRKSHSMKERQEALMDAFASDMDYYRTHGKPDRLPSGTEFPKVSSLSEITIEEDKKALDEFLETGDGAHVELAQEEAFFEDDYTADYSAADEHNEIFPELDDTHPINFDDDSKSTSDASHAENKESSDSVNTETNDSQLVAGKSKEAQEAVEKADHTVSEGQVSTHCSDPNEKDEKELDVSQDT